MKITKQEITKTFQKEYPHVDISSGAGVFLFQGYVTGMARKNVHRDNKIKELMADLKEKDDEIAKLHTHIAGMTSMMKGLEKKGSVELAGVNV